MRLQADFGRWGLGRGRQTAIGVGLLALMACACLLPGCYKRVVRAKGLGADTVAVSEPYQESSKIDDWMFGKEEHQSKSLLNRGK